MPIDHLPNVFNSFDNLYQIDTSFIQSKLSFSMPPIVIENYVANRLLFPVAIPQTKAEAELELAILSAVVALNSGFFYNQTLSKITIPPEYNLIYQDINQLVRAVATSVGLHGQASIVIPNLTGHNTTGSVISIVSGNNPLEIIYNNQKTTLSPNAFLHLPPKSSSTISINGTDYELPPGELGIYIISL